MKGGKEGISSRRVHDQRDRGGQTTYRGEQGF